MLITDKYGREYEHDGILPDGFSMKVPMVMMDSVQKKVAATFRTSAMVTDAYGDSDLFALRRPGPRYGAHPTRADINKMVAYDEANEADANAWRKQPPTPPPIQPVASNRSADAQPPLVEDREAVLREVEERDNNAWQRGNQ
jgi:hypothetical protein